MEPVIDLACGLAAELKNSRQYENYCLAKAEVDKDDRLVKQIQGFKRAHMDFQLKTMDGSTGDFDDEKKLCTIYSELMLQEKARLFLESETCLLDLLSRVFEIVGAACPIEIDE